MEAWHSCHPETGTPLCPLATAGCFSVQVRGASAQECLDKKRIDDAWWTRKCKVMVIGEGPGWEEDKLGIPFVGKTGSKLFNTFMIPAGFDLDEVFMTNTVRCKPPKERDPNKPVTSEIQACKTHIDWEMRHFEPDVVILLGNTALRVFNLDKQGSIKSIHGKLFQKKFPGWDDGPIFKVIPTYHPAFFLHRHSPRLENRVKRDYIFARNVAKGGDIKYSFHRAPYKLCETVKDLEEVRDVLLASKEFAYDTESVKAPWYKDPMICISLSVGEGKNYIVPIYRHDPDGVDLKLKAAWPSEVDVKKYMKGPFESPDIAKIAHNIKYDNNVMRKWLDIRVQGMLWDTMLMHHVIEEQGPHDLEYLSDIEFLTGDYGAPVRAITGHGNKLKKTYDHVPDEIMYPYTATDAECTFRLKQLYHDVIVKKPHLYKLYMKETYPIIEVLTESEWYGNKIHIPTVEVLFKEQDERKEKCSQKILKITQDADFNPASHKQVAEILRRLGYGKQIENKRNAVGYSVNEETMEKLAIQGCDLATLVIEYRKIGKLQSTYLQKAIDDIDDDGRLRYSFSIHGTETGRLSARFLHQIPRIDKERRKKGKANLRDFFIAEPGYSHVYGDYSQIELRILSIEAEDMELKRCFRDGEDVHSATAAAALDISYDDVTDDTRQIGKGINFGTVFGSKGYSLTKKTFFVDPKDGKRKKVTMSMVTGFIASFLDKFKGVAQYLKDIPLLAMSNNGLILNRFGRERHIEGLNNSNKGKREHAEREAVNYKIQSPAGAITIRTAIAVWKMLREKKISPEDIRLVNTVHDSLDYEVKDCYVKWFMVAFKMIAERPIKELENASFPVDIGVGLSWTEAELDTK